MKPALPQGKHYYQFGCFHSAFPPGQSHAQKQKQYGFLVVVVVVFSINDTLLYILIFHLITLVQDLPPSACMD